VQRHSDQDRGVNTPHSESHEKSTRKNKSGPIRGPTSKRSAVVPVGFVEAASTRKEGSEKIGRKAEGGGTVPPFGKQGLTVAKMSARKNRGEMGGGTSRGG